ncbi:MAG: tetratricopeptide repeat protein [Rhizobiaceae bacterium]
MRISEVNRGVIIAAAAAILLGGTAQQALSFDRKSAESKKESPWAVFRFGFSAYKKGQKLEAVEAYRYAAEKGQVGASWKLGRMYAEGDGVERNDLEAFKFFVDIASRDVEPNSPDAPYVSDALVAVAHYLKRGIPGTNVAANPIASRDYYMRAAATYRNPTAQFEMGRMFLAGDGVRRNVKQAGRWLQLATEKGHAGAQALLGDLLYRSGKAVQGLAMMTAALQRAAPIDRSWIQGMQEEAFALAGEADRRTAIALSQDLLTNRK